MNFTEARDIQFAWKSEAMRDAAVALVRAGIAQQDRGEPCFGPDDVPDSYEYGGQGICGSVIHVLRTAHIIEDYFGPAYPHGRRKSRRATANGRKVCLYRLTNRGIAEALMRRYGVVETRQMELAV